MRYPVIVSHDHWLGNTAHVTERETMAMPTVVGEPFIALDPSKKYQITAWHHGTVRTRQVRTGSSAQSLAAGMFRVLNAGSSGEARWTNQGEEMKISFARPWIESDTVVYVQPI